MYIFLKKKKKSIDFVYHFEEMDEPRRANNTDKGFLD